MFTIFCGSLYGGALYVGRTACYTDVSKLVSCLTYGLELVRCLPTFSSFPFSLSNNFINFAVIMKQKEPQKGRKQLLLPVLPILFVAIYLWAAWYYGDVLRMARERSFWVSDTEQMDFLLGQEYGGLWYIGRLMMMLFRYPWAGSLLLASMITWSTWCIGYGLRLTARWRWIQYLPAGVFMTWIAYEGVNIYLENEAGAIMGIPFCATVILTIWTVMIASFSRKKVPTIIAVPKDETPWQNRVQLLAVVFIFAAQALVTEVWRPYNRVIAKMNVSLLDSDWQGIMETARENAEMSYRPIAANYAIALVNTNQICERLYDIRLDYDSLYVHRRNAKPSDSHALYLYQEDCDYYAGFIQTCIHHAVERVTMVGPNIHSIELLTKCALMRGEWEVAKKYLRILKDVPWESDFVEKYSAYVGMPDKVESDKEMAFIRQLEPINDSFENEYQQPAFLGYNAALMEGRSRNALMNSLAVCMYSKAMPAFMMRTKPLEGTLPPENVADALCLMITKDEGILQRFPGMDFRRQKMAAKVGEMKPYMKDRAKYARELFPWYKGYYPYYYFFGNLKATRKTSKKEGSSTAGVN